MAPSRKKSSSIQLCGSRISRFLSNMRNGSQKAAKKNKRWIFSRRETADKSKVLSHQSAFQSKRDISYLFSLKDKRGSHTLASDLRDHL